MQILVNVSKTMIKKKSRLTALDENLLEEQVTLFNIDEMLPLVMELPLEFRMVTLLYYYEDFSTNEISKMLKIPNGTVKSRLARGREKLSQLIKW
ncbi:RNA polymerase sigma-70 factor, ECF subfamily [Lachnospiraceae bacterium KM106-2]|nr:RNA polymerase sigma-70 factor, ECF subfamily [Lachnospiraceae bacterium KM106-2]